MREAWDVSGRQGVCKEEQQESGSIAPLSPVVLDEVLEAGHSALDAAKEGRLGPDSGRADVNVTHTIVNKVNLQTNQDRAVSDRQ